MKSNFETFFENMYFLKILLYSFIHLANFAFVGLRPAFIFQRHSVSGKVNTCYLANFLQFF